MGMTLPLSWMFGRIFLFEIFCGIYCLKDENNFPDDSAFRCDFSSNWYVWLTYPFLIFLV